MKRMQMVDLLGQYEGIQEEVDKAVLDVVRSSKYINGPEVKDFAAELASYLGAGHVIPCGNGTDALQIAMMGLGLQPGDEVITASFTYVATAEVIALLGLKPILVDADPETFNIDPEAIRKAITPQTKAIVPVHLFGQCADMETIMSIAREHDLYVIEDTAQAIGAEYTFSDGTTARAGTIGHAGCTSFFPSKNLGCYGDGGAIATNDEVLADKLRSITNHGQGEKYHHDRIGVNSRLDTLQAAILRIKLKRLDQYNRARQEAADAYDQALAGLEQVKVPARHERSSHVFHQYTLQLEGVDRDDLKEHLAQQGIPSMVYYPVPLHLQKAYRDDRYPEGSLPVTETLCQKVLSLPMHTELTEEQTHTIIKALKAYLS